MELDAEEVAGYGLEVTAADIGFEKYVTAAERARIAEEEARRAAEAALKKDNAQARALDDMMGGRLEVETGASLLESDVPREAWMDEVPMEKRTEEQAKAYYECAARRRAPRVCCACSGARHVTECTRMRLFMHASCAFGCAFLV